VKDYLVNLGGAHGIFLPCKGDDVIDAATRLYEKLCKDRDVFFVSVLGQGYEKGVRPTEDNIKYFLNEVVVANAGEYNNANKLKEIVTIIDEDNQGDENDSL
jgi:hypothetical protein